MPLARTCGMGRPPVDPRLTLSIAEARQAIERAEQVIQRSRDAIARADRASARVWRAIAEYERRHRIRELEEIAPGLG